ncbi:MAG: DcaP family trimeric outer membrane transporter [Rikenellaceae bacterium]
MKAFSLLIAATLLTTAVSANDSYKSKEKLDEEVLIISDGSTESVVYQFSSPERVKEHIREREYETERTKQIAIAQLASLRPSGFQSTDSPLFVMTQKDNKFAFAVGGYIALTSSYDFCGVVENADFVTADIPIPGDYSTKQQLMMDASTSRVYLHGVANSCAVGPIEVYIDADFRGSTGYSSSGVTNSYKPRVRTAYVKLLGFTMGRDITTFCDLDAAPTTIDFQGPNAYSFNYATLLRYTYTSCNEAFSAALALEQPNVSGTYSTTFEAIPQRMPDVPMYVQFRLGRNLQHHLRLSGVVRNMYMYNSTTNDNISLLGWGAKLSGRLQPDPVVGLCFNATYGEGITNYIQDLNGLGLDFTPDPTNYAHMQTMPMWAWQAALNFNISERLTANGGYSTVKVQKNNGYYSDNQYRSGEYIFGNLFYMVTPRFALACEYIYGDRRNMNCMTNSANRASLMAKFSF